MKVNSCHLKTSNMMDEEYLSGDDLVIKVRKPYTITKKRERWTQEEHQKFLEGLKLHGRAWRCIEDHIATKSAIQIRSHAQKFFSKLGRQQSGGSVASGSTSEEIDIPPPRPKRKPIHPYPRKAIKAFDTPTRLHSNGSSPGTKSSHLKRCTAASMVFTAGGGISNVEQLASKDQQSIGSLATTLKLFGQNVVVSAAVKSLTPASTAKAKKVRRTSSRTVLTQESGKSGRTLSIMYDSAYVTESNRDNHNSFQPRSGSGNAFNCAKPSSRSASKVSSESSLLDSGISNLHFEHEPHQTCQIRFYDFYPKEQCNTVLNHGDPFKICSSSQNAAGQYCLPVVANQQQAYHLPVVPDLNYDQCLRGFQLACCSLGDLDGMTAIVPPCESVHPLAPLQLFKQDTCTMASSAAAVGATTAFRSGILPQAAPASMISPLFASVSLGRPSEEADLLHHTPHAKDNTKVQIYHGINPEQNIESANEANSIKFTEMCGRRFLKEHSRDKLQLARTHHTVLTLATAGLEEPVASLPTFAEGSNLSFIPKKTSQHDHKKKETKRIRQSSFSGSNFFLCEDTGSDVHKKQKAIAFVADSNAAAAAQAYCDVMSGASGGPSSSSSNCEDSQDAAAQIGMQRSGKKERSSYVGGIDQNQGNNIKHACYKQKAESNKSSSSGATVMHQSCKRKVKQ